MQSDNAVLASDAVLALAFIGDLSMGRPTDHSARTGWLAAQTVAAAGGGEQDCHHAHLVSLLRWSGCTANAAGFDELFGDDVGGRNAMLTHTLSVSGSGMQQKIAPLAQIHCEVSGDIAATLGMPLCVENSLRHIFATYDGQAGLDGLPSEEVPLLVYGVALASDLEILSRAHGLEAALRYIGEQADHKYPAALVATLIQHADGWLAELNEMSWSGPAASRFLSGADHQVQLSLVADVIDLKLPWMAGYSRAVADLALAAASLQGLDEQAGAQLYRAGLIHGIGRAALPNSLWNTPTRLLESDWERMRLTPYWTSRAARQIDGLAAEGGLASYVYERHDGSGYFRGVGGDALSPAQRLLAVAAVWIALRSARPWRAAFTPAEAVALMKQEVAHGKFESHAVHAVLAAAQGDSLISLPKAQVLLSDREASVLRRISLGESSKEVARVLEISPSTVRTHVESIFRKLGCSTRAAATLKAFTLGLL